jgi:two-component system, NarL family, response regulator
MKPSCIRVLIVDDHVMVRMGLASLLSDEPDIEVVGQARDAAEGIALFEALQPTVTLMDGMLPDMHGTAAVRHIVSRQPLARIILVSIHESPEDIHSAMCAGARGYVPKSAEQGLILQAIRSVAAGNRFLPPELARRLADRNASVGLSHRETEILRLVAKGKGNKEIAAELGLSGNTVKSHIAHIFAKLNAPDRTRAVTIAIELGLIRL